jgi:hypothetical protein
MSLIGRAIGAVLPTKPAPTATILRPRRRIGQMVAQVVIEELHQDELQITEHPVEQGYSITDHAFIKPAELTLRFGWAPSGQTSDAPMADYQYLQGLYQDLLTLQRSRIPMDIVTGKRHYKNMLLSAVSVTTDEHSELVLAVSAQCREIRIAKTRILTVPPREVHKEPEKTAEPQHEGTKSPVRKSLAKGPMDAIRGAMGGN